MTAKMTGSIILDTFLAVFVFVFPRIYDFIVAFISYPLRGFFIESRELIQWLIAVLVLAKFIKDLFFKKSK